MKLTLSVLLLISALIGFSQEPPKGTILIVVKNNYNKEVNLIKVNRVLGQNGYQIGSIDSTQTWVESRKKRFANSNASYRFYFIVKDSAIAVYGKITDAYMPNTLSNQVYLYIQKSGKPNSLLRLTFDIMLDLATQLGGNRYFITELNDFQGLRDKEDRNNDDLYYTPPSKSDPENKPAIEI